MLQFFLLLTGSLVLYVYRFHIGGVNLSPFRLVLLGWLIAACLHAFRTRPFLTPRMRWLLVLCAALVVINAIDFVGLGGYPALRRDIANHLLNLSFAGLIVLYVDDDRKIRALLVAFVLSSVMTTAITVYSMALNHLPFESTLRSLASDVNRGLAYTNDDGEFRRATSSFFDPNFYGIYSMLVLIATAWLWLYDGRRRWFPWLFVVNLACLTLTLSRTAVIGLLVALAVLFALERRARIFTVGVAISTVVGLYGSTALQSYAYRKYLVQEVGSWFKEAPGKPQVTRTDSGSPTSAGAQGVAEPPAPAITAARALLEVQKRAGSTESFAQRLTYIRRGLEVFRSSPIWGRGSASLLAPDIAWSSAHITYLTLLARYGIIGAAVYGLFFSIPLLVVWEKAAAKSYRTLVSASLIPLLVIYLSYDIFLFFEVQYLFFGLAYAIVVHRPGWATPPLRQRALVSAGAA